jgi:hypothetical protein
MSHLPARIFPGQNPVRPVRACRATTRTCFTCTDAANSAASHETYQLSRVRFANKSPSRQLSGLWPSSRTFSHVNPSRHKAARRGHFQFGFGDIVSDLFCFFNCSYHQVSRSAGYRVFASVGGNYFFMVVEALAVGYDFYLFC